MPLQLGDPILYEARYQMPDLRAALSDHGLLTFYEYWESLRGNREMPSRKDIDPLQVPRGYLPSIMLVDVLYEPQRYRYRLVGSNIVAATGENRTGRYFDEVSWFREHPGVQPQYEAAVKTGQPLYSVEPFTNFISQAAYEVDRLLLPLSDDGRRVDTLLVLFQFNSGPFAARLPGNSVSTLTPAIA